jgi:S-adenosylmethionine synthetase
MGLYVDTYGTAKVNLTDGEIARKLENLFDMRPFAIETRFNLRTPIYSESAAYGHMGRECTEVEKVFKDASGTIKKMNVKLFPWEELNFVKNIKADFSL